MADFLNERRLGWILAVVGAFQLATMAVDWAIGDGLNAPSLAIGLFLLPEGLHQLARSYDNRPLAQRLRTLTGYSVTLAGVVLWSVLIKGWASGDGTNWWILIPALALLAAGALALAGLVAKRRSARAGTSGRMAA
ncbi:hypothetical protein [Streptomyces gobiensis]|uniref:hypothetical protein n=1 Tax=Streptomyces gobiensis TaxID=2875706 RepID=UPI001E5F1C2C|nr:hypothetical protein [Streptomyces gobiensis]UGY91363.1 hypothetical protein test1122_06260 [Streptomyces gobiensis]